MGWSPEQDKVYMDDRYVLHYPEGASQYDGMPPELKEIYDPHWGTFPPQHPLIFHIIGFAFAFLWFFSFFGNGMVIYIFLKVPSLRTPTNMFIINLALSDMCMMTTQALPVFINIWISRWWAWGVLGCKIYACIGGIFGTVSILSMVVIGYDRYNVIVKGFSGVKITSGKAFIILLTLWVYSTAVCIPPFLGWGGYSAEGLLLTCSYDYQKTDWNHVTFMYHALFFNYLLPLIIIIGFYTQIVKAVVMHEAALKAQAKKMNVESLRSGDQSGESAEVRIAKVAITNVMLWVCIWTPYATVVAVAVFGNKAVITPLVSGLPSALAKTASGLNPLVYAISHPKFREGLAEHLPCLGIGEKKKDSSEGLSANTKA